MLQTMRKHLTYSNLAATLALLFAITGGAFAATGGGSNRPARATASVSGATGRSGVSDRVIVTAAKKKAKAKAPARGPAGPAGKNGTNGTNGAPGAAGSVGPAGPTGP